MSGTIIVCHVALLVLNVEEFVICQVFKDRILPKKKKKVFKDSNITHVTIMCIL